MTNPDINKNNIFNNEPLNLAQALHLLLGAIVTLGWIKIDNTTINAIVTIISVIISISVQLWARSKVTPVKKMTG